MIVFFFILILLCLYNITPPRNTLGHFTDYLSIDKTNSIKGIFILIVFMQHSQDYIELSNTFDSMYKTVLGLIGQRMVTLFMLYSGYGVMESIKKKQMAYVKAIPKNRILSVLFRFDNAILLFLIAQLIINKGQFPYPVYNLIFSFIGWESIGNSNWYIFAIIVAYFATYLGFTVFKDKKNYKMSVIATTLLIIIYGVILRYGKLKDSTIWYDTVLCYSLGMVISLYKDEFEKIFQNALVYWLSIIAALFIQACNYKFGNNILIRELAMLSFALTVVLITMKISIGNKYLKWCGEHLFGIYILQRLPMMIFKELGIADFNKYLYFLICLITTLAIAFLFEKYVSRLWQIISNKKRNQTAL